MKRDGRELDRVTLEDTLHEEDTRRRVEVALCRCRTTENHDQCRGANTAAGCATTDQTWTG